MDAYAHLREAHREPYAMLKNALAQWGGRRDLWLFGYASLIWNPGFVFTEQRMARVYGHHRALKMWSRINRGTPQEPGLVFALLAGGSCQGLVFRIPRAQGHDVMCRLWEREMPTGVYDPLWLTCHTTTGTVKALAFVLPRGSPNYTGDLSAQQYQHIFAKATGRYGSTLDYACKTLHSLQSLGITDHSLARILSLAK